MPSGLTINIQKQTFGENNSATNVRRKEKKHSLARSILIGTGITAGFLAADLFITRGKISSTLTGGNVSCIKTMSEELDHIVKNDLATKNRLEAFLCTPGLHAIWGHRVIHKLNNWKIPVLPRLFSNISRSLTGIEIHPGAKIGKNVFIDHTGAIIGETAEIGNNVSIVGRVVLGSTGKGDSVLRHTIVEDNVLIGMNSTMLGRIRLGKNSKIGAGTVVTHDVPPDVTIIGNPATIISIKGERLKKPLILNEYSGTVVKEYLTSKTKEIK